MIEDLLDVSCMMAGKLPVELKPADLVPILESSLAGRTSQPPPQQ